MSTLVPIVVTEQIGTPAGTSPTGSVQFLLTEEIVAPQECSAIVVGADYVNGLLAQQLVANDLDSSGDPISPATTMYGVKQEISGAAPREYFITVPAVPPGSRSVSDVVTVNGTSQITSATADFSVDDVGAYILLNNGLVVPPGTQIYSFIDSHTVTLTQTPTASLTGVEILIGASVSLGSLRPPG